MWALSPRIISSPRPQWLSTEALFEAGWPGERAIERAARNRVQQAMSTLRKLGLRSILDAERGRYRLREDLLVERSPCSSDGRGADAVLTDEGLRRLRAASRIHLRGIDRYYFEQVSPDDQEVVGRAADAVECVVTEGLETAMSRFNGSRKPGAREDRT